MSLPEFSAGSTIAGRYRLTSLLGQGGMGSVWRAEHLALGSEVAVKLIDPTIAQNEEARARFVREAKSAAALRSPHVVQILDFGVDGQIPFIVMELMKGESLADRLERLGRLTPEQTSRIMTDVSRALTKAHEAGIIHRDLKPDNVFLVDNDDEEVAKVLDFGVARVTDFSTEKAHMTSTGAVLGTPYYMSPEQAEGSRELDHRTDIWALAVMTYECMVGVRPFQGETLGGLFVAICAREIPTPSLIAAVPNGFDAWFKRGTSRILSDRFRTAREAAQALRDVCTQELMTSGAATLRGSAALDATMVGAGLGTTTPAPGAVPHPSSSTGGIARVAGTTNPGGTAAAVSATTTNPAAANSTAGLAHTQLPAIPMTGGGAKRSFSPWLGVALVAIGGLSFALWSQKASAPSDTAAAAAEVPSGAAPAAKVEVAKVEPAAATPAAAAQPAPPASMAAVAAPEPAPSAAATPTAVAARPAQAAAPKAAAAKPAPKAAAKPAAAATTEKPAEPKPAKVNLGI